jgi:hypothetical protein
MTSNCDAANATRPSISRNVAGFSESRSWCGAGRLREVRTGRMRLVRLALVDHGRQHLLTRGHLLAPPSSSVGIP